MKNLNAVLDKLQVPAMQSKLNQDLGGKLKTTNPKPFRLRTDVSYYIIQHSLFAGCQFSN